MINHLKVLMVEDDIEIGKYTKQKIELLTNVGSFIWETSISGALKSICNELPDVVILDLKLQDGNGIELLKKIKIEKLPVKVFVFSINTSLKNCCLRLGAEAFFDKNSESEELMMRIKKSELHKSLPPTNFI